MLDSCFTETGFVPVLRPEPEPSSPQADTVELTAITKAANDETLNIATSTGTATGLTAAPTSANTTRGAAVADAGATFLKVTGTGAITSSTAVDTNLTIVGGQWAVQTDNATQYKYGRLLKQITPSDPGHVRIGIEVSAEPALGQ